MCNTERGADIMFFFDLTYDEIVRLNMPQIVHRERLDSHGSEVISISDDESETNDDGLGFDYEGEPFFNNSRFEESDSPPMPSNQNWGWDTDNDDDGVNGVVRNNVLFSVQTLNGDTPYDLNDFELIDVGGENEMLLDSTDENWLFNTLVEEFNVVYENTASVITSNSTNLSDPELDAILAEFTDNFFDEPTPVNCDVIIISDEED